MAIKDLRSWLQYIKPSCVCVCVHWKLSWASNIRSLGSFPSLWNRLTATRKEGATKPRRKVPAAASRRTWLPEAPPAHTDTAPEPEHKARRSDVHVQRHTLSPTPHSVLRALPPLWSSWWSAGGEWGSSLDPSSPSPPGSSGSWTGPPNTSALEKWEEEMNKDPQSCSKAKRKRR